MIDASQEQRPLSEDEISALRVQLMVDSEREGGVLAVAQRIANNSRIPRRLLFLLLTDIAAHHVNRLENVEHLIRIWGGDAGTPFMLACSLHQRGEVTAARKIFDQFFLRDSLAGFSDDNIRRVQGAAVLVENYDAATSSLEILFSRATQSPATVIPAVCSGLHALAHKGLLEEAFAGWDRLHSLLPGNMQLAGVYRTFLKKYPSRTEIIAMHNSPPDSAVAIPHDRRQFLLLLASSPASRFELLQQSIKDLEIHPDPAAVDFWVQMTNTLANNFSDASSANELWKVILTYAPERVRSFLRFSRKYNRQGENSDIDALIVRSHSLLHSMPADSSRVPTGPISIGAERRSVADWLQELAGRLLNNGEACSSLALSLHRYDNRLSNQLISLFQEAAIANPQHFLTVIPDLVIAQPPVHGILNSVVRRLGSHPVVDRIVQAVQEVSVNDPNTLNLITTYYINTNQFERIPAVWTGINTATATMCAHFAGQMLRLKQPRIAAALFREVALVAPEECIRFGYQYFCQSEAANVVLECIEPLLSDGSEESVERHSLLALRLLKRHGGELRAGIIVRKLSERGVIGEKDIRKIFSTRTIVVTSAGEVEESHTFDRDEEIEEYLLKKMPTLKRSAFFREMQDRQPKLEAGEKTTRAAYSVVAAPWREKDGTDRIPPPKGKKKKQ